MSRREEGGNGEGHRPGKAGDSATWSSARWGPYGTQHRATPWWQGSGACPHRFPVLSVIIALEMFVLRPFLLYSLGIRHTV